MPNNIFLYVASIPNLAKLGHRFILQGGTQKNLAAVKSKVDFIKSHFRSDAIEREVIVHEHCGESGAIGAAVMRWAIHMPLWASLAGNLTEPFGTLAIPPALWAARIA